MKSTKLIIIEGLPGSGKSTTAGKIASMFSEKGVKVVCVDEGVPNHPADYDNYDFPNFATERKCILNKWKDFVNDAADDTIYVFNCIFLQNPMCETMMRFNMSIDQSCDYICEIANIIFPLSPVIYYLEQFDVKKAIEDVLDERGIDWLKSVIDYHTEQGYGKSHNLCGFDGYIACLEERQKRELYILEKTGLEYKILNGKPSETTLEKLELFK